MSKIDDLVDEFDEANEVYCRVRSPEAFANYDAARAALLAEFERLEALIPQWVSVEDRLPEKSGRYIVTKRIGTMDYVDMAHFNGRDWGTGIIIVSWMPLPPPPK